VPCSTDAGIKPGYGAPELLQGEGNMTDYERLAADLGTTLDGAVRLARAASRGETMTDREAGLVTAWEARTVPEPWFPETAQQTVGG
jgi:hypothetical protein